MNATQLSTRIMGILFSIAMSASVLGATVMSMQPAQIANGAPVVALERVTVTATAVN